MNYNKYIELTKSYNMIPVYEVITGDLLTPVLAYLKLREKGKQSFLLESVEGDGNFARYSFIGVNPTSIVSNKGNLVEIKNGEGNNKIEGNIFEYLNKIIAENKSPNLEELPSFTGGFVGFIGYENISLIENTLHIKENNITNFDSILGFYQTIVAFDHYKHQLIIINNIKLDSNSNIELKYNEAKKSINKIKSLLLKPIDYKSDFSITGYEKEEINSEKFYSKVESCKENIKNGDVYQIVISERFSAEYEGDSFNVYRSLRTINPSPYMYYLQFENDFTIIGTSPEDLVKVNGKQAQVLPIAGTRKRGKDKEEDLRMENDLLNDPKELSEHTMLVDLGRNDLGRVSVYDSVKVKEFQKIHKYSHVMHLVSRVESKLLNECNSLDALQACFPAGTVTGAPKLKAIELINQLESEARNVYAGAIGYIDLSGNLDMCISIRTLYSIGKKIYWQAGAGIVYDSKPELELKEIYNKSAVLKSALKYAEVIDENISN